MKALKILSQVVSAVAAVALATLLLALAGMRVIGLKPFAVTSGSMEPAYPEGSLIYVKHVDYNNLRVGDDITYMLDENTVATSRILYAVADAEDSSVIYFFTQGIANDVPDEAPVHCLNIIGKPVLTIRDLGYAYGYIQSPPGICVTVAACAILILLMFLPDLFGDGKKKGISVKKAK